MTASYSGAAPDPVDRLEPLGVPFRRFFSILRRRAWLVLLIVSLGVSGTVAYVRQIAPRYTAQASVLVEPRRSQVSDLQALSPDADGTSLMRTQVEIVRSPALARRVVERLGLTTDPVFNAPPGPLARAINKLHRLVSSGGPRHVPTAEERIEAATAALLGIVWLQNEARSNVLHIKTETGSPALAAAIANEFAKQYLEFRRNQKYDAIDRAHAWFSGHLGELAERSREAERAVEAYRAEHGLAETTTTRTGAPNAPTVHRQQMDEVVRQIATIAGDRARKEAQLEQARDAIRRQRGPDALLEVLSSPIVQRLREQEAIAAAREAELASVQGDRGPDLMAIRAQRRGLQRRIQEEMTNATTGLANEVAAARTQEQTMRDRLQELRSAVNIDNSAEVYLQGLVAEAQASRQVYESFLVRATQLANVAGIQEPEAELVSAARPPLSPSAPKRSQMIAIVGFASLILGIILACVVERFTDGFGTPEALEVGLGITPIGIVPKVAARLRRNAVRGFGGPNFATSLNHLCGMLQLRCQLLQSRVVMVTSALPQEGKTMLAVSLAHSAAAAGQRVLLIDCDLRNPSVAVTCDILPEPGLAEMLSGNSLAGSAPVVRQIIPGLDVMPSGVAQCEPQSLLASARMARILDDARARYDLVIVDAPPVLPVTDALFLSRAVDVTLMAVRWQRTPRAAASDAVDLLRGAGATILGTVLTQVHMASFTRMSGGGLAHVHRSYRGYYHPLIPAAAAKPLVRRA